MKTLFTILLLLSFCVTVAVEPVFTQSSENTQYQKHFGETVIHNSIAYSLVGSGDYPTQVELLDMRTGNPINTTSILEILTHEVNLDTAKYDLNSIFVFTNTVYVAYTVLKQSTVELYAVALDEIGDVSGNEMVIHNLALKSQNKNTFFAIRVSPDGRRLAVAGLNEKHGSTSKSDFTIRSYAMSLKFPVEQTLTYPKYQSMIQTSSIQMQVSNNGIVAVSAVFGKNGHTKNAQDVLMTVVNSNNGKQYHLNKFCPELDYEQLHLAFNKYDDTFVFYGFYLESVNYIQRLQGLVSVIVDEVGKAKPNVTVAPFSTKLLASFYKKSESNLPEKAGLSANYKHHSLHIYPNGKMALLFEYNIQYPSILGGMKYESNSIGVMRINSEKQISAMHRVYKKQEVKDLHDTNYLSFIPLFRGDDIYFVYLDNPLNQTHHTQKGKCSYMTNAFTAIPVAVRLKPSGHIEKYSLATTTKLQSAPWFSASYISNDANIIVPLVPQEFSWTDVYAGNVALQYGFIKFETETLVTP